MRVIGWDAIEVAKLSGLELCKYADPIEPARDDLSVDEAEDVAREDPSLIYLDIEFLGWRIGNDQELDAEDEIGLLEEYYWDESGRFMGPDDSGIYPVYGYGEDAEGE